MEKKKPHLIMPMGGQGSRFSQKGFNDPKPLIEIAERPFFYWATRSIEKYVDVADVTFVVLNQHIEENQIDSVIRKYYPLADIIAIDFKDVVQGPVMTCLAGLRNIHDENPIILNDCDHMFKCTRFYEDVNEGVIDYNGALLSFNSNRPLYSYIRYENGRIVGTVEKKAVSNNAICGAYVVNNAKTFKIMAEKYINVCNDNEYFISGIYNVMCEESMVIKNYPTDFHVPFGTPDEYETAKKSIFFEELR